MYTSSPNDHSFLVYVLMDNQELYQRCIACTPKTFEVPWRQFFIDKLDNLLLLIERDADERDCAKYWCTMVQLYDKLRRIDVSEANVGTVLLTSLFLWLQIKINRIYMSTCTVYWEEGKVIVATKFTEAVLAEIVRMEQEQVKGEIAP